MPVFSKALEESEYNRDTLASHIGADPMEVASWLQSNTVPEEWEAEVQLALGTSLDKPTEEKKKETPKKKSTRKRRSSSSSRTGISAETSNALAVLASLMKEPEDVRNVVASLVGEDVDVTDPEGLADVTKGVLTLNKSTKDALATIEELSGIENPLRIGLKLGSLDRRSLNEVHRVTSMLNDVPERELSGGDDAFIEVAENIGLLVEQNLGRFEWFKNLLS